MAGRIPGRHNVGWGGEHGVGGGAVGEAVGEGARAAGGVRGGDVRRCVGARRAAPVERGVSARVDAGRQAQVDRADGRQAAGRRRAGLAAVRQPVAVGRAGRCARTWRGGCCAEIEPEAWIVDDTGFPKKGRYSVGVARQYSGRWARSTTARSGCRSTPPPMSRRARSTGACSCPRSGTTTASGGQGARARRSASPPKWRLALDMIDELGSWGLSRRWSAADGGYGDITEFRQGLDQRELRYVLQVKGADLRLSRARRARAARLRGTGRPPARALPRAALVAASELALAAGKRAARASPGGRARAGGCTRASWRCACVPPTSSCAPPRTAADAELPVRWLLAEWPADADAPTEYWLSNLPADTELRDARPARQAALADRARLPRAQRRARARPLRGPQLPRLAPPRHLVSVAHAFLTLERRRPPTRAAA